MAKSIRNTLLVTKAAYIRCGVAILAIALGLVLMPIDRSLAGGCVNEAIRSGLNSDRLPDCRAYELVSPAAKSGWNVFVVNGYDEHVVVNSLGGFAGSTQTSLISLYDIKRTGAGWITASFIEPPGLFDPIGENVLDESPELTEGLFAYRSINSPFLGERNLYVHATPTGGIEEIGPVFSQEALNAAPANTEESFSTPSTSNDFSRVVFAIPGAALAPYHFLWPGDKTVTDTNPGAGRGFASLYEYTYQGRRLAAPTLVGLDNEGHQISQCGASLGFPSGGNFTELSADENYNAVSADGSRVFFTAAAADRGPGSNFQTCTEAGDGSGPPANELFDRERSEQGGQPHLRTVAISEPSTTDCSSCITNEPKSSVFQGASKDGSKAFFLTEQQLLEGAEGNNLYEYDASANGGQRVRLVSPNVYGVARVSEDGSHVYFVAGKIFPGSNKLGISPTDGAPNLYVSVTECPEGGTACQAPKYSIRFIGTLSLQDQQDWQQKDNRPVDATPNGRFLVFISTAHLTPADTSNAAQVFEYDSQTDTLVRASIGENGFNRNGNTDIFPASIVRQSYDNRQNPAPQLSSVSNDGAVVVFQSNDALTAQAIGTEGSPNVYEYDNGHVSLISDGQDHTLGPGGTPSTSLVGVSASGADIFFTTADRLVPQDGDTQQDVYDARINGGFPAPALPPACEGDGCQGALAGVPSFPSIATGQGEQITGPIIGMSKGKAKKVTKTKKMRRVKRNSKAKNRKVHRHKRATGNSHA